MGVDYYTCSNYERNFPDCMSYFTCGSCEERFCSAECGGMKYVEDEDGDRPQSDWGDLTTCVLCRYEVVLDSDLLSFLLKKFELTYEQAVDMFRKDSED